MTSELRSYAGLKTAVLLHRRADGHDVPPEWRPVVPRLPTPLPEARPTPVPSRTAPLRASRARLDGLVVRAKLPADAYAAFRGLGATGWRHLPPARWLAWSHTSEFGAVRLLANDHADGRGRHLVGVRLLQQRGGVDPGLDDDAVCALGFVLGFLGPGVRWDVARLDVAVDYPAWVWDLNPLLDGSRAASRFVPDDDDDPLDAGTFYRGSPRSAVQVRCYWRGFKGDSVTRVEVVHRPPKPGGRAVTIGDLGRLGGAMDRVTVRPMWGDVDDGLGWLLRGVQERGGGPAKMPHAIDGVVLTDSARRRVWGRTRAALADPEALAVIEQPAAVTAREWPGIVARFERARRTGAMRGRRAAGRSR